MGQLDGGDVLATLFVLGVLMFVLVILQPRKKRKGPKMLAKRPTSTQARKLTKNQQIAIAHIYGITRQLTTDHCSVDREYRAHHKQPFAPEGDDVEGIVPTHYDRVLAAVLVRRILQRLFAVSDETWEKGASDIIDQMEDADDEACEEEEEVEEEDEEDMFDAETPDELTQEDAAQQLQQPPPPVPVPTKKQPTSAPSNAEDVAEEKATRKKQKKSD